MSRSATYSLLVLAGCIWGFQPVLLKGLLAFWTPVTVAVVRFFFMGICLLAVQYCRNNKDLHRILPHAADWPWILLMGLAGQMLNNVLGFQGLQYTSVTNNTLITSLTPAMTAILAFFFLKEHLTGRQWLGILLSFGGVLLLISKGDVTRLLTLQFNRGDLLCIIGQAAWSVYTLASRKVSGHFDLLTALGWCSLFASFGTCLFGLASGLFHLTALPPIPLTACLYTTFLGGIAANVCWNLGVSDIGPSLTSVFLNIIPAVGMFSGWFFLAEPMGPLQLGGAFLVLCGVRLTSRQPRPEAAHMHYR